MDSNTDTLNSSANLKRYYDKIFPSEQLFKWLSYGQQDAFSKREFSFTLDENVYIRYQSFENVKEFTDELKKKVPNKIDIGAVYNVKPKLNKSLGGGQIVPLWKELVFDIDMDDYNDVRTCCSKEEVKICAKCWTVMKVAVRVLDRVLREDFGYNHVMWVFSGRRGIHCWVSDPEARVLTAEVRSAIVSYMTLIKGTSGQKRVKLYPDEQWRRRYHPSVVKAIETVKKYFVQYALTDQGLLETPERVERILAMFPNTLLELHDRIKNLWTSETALGQSEARWRILVEYFSKSNDEKVIEEIMLECLYPRLDAGVSKGLNHLLKSPFCVHPSTGRICVPFLADEVDEFDPFSVPTIEEVLSELAATNGEVMATSVGKYIKIFEDFVASLPRI